jgi:hypothetical protein
MQAGHRTSRVVGNPSCANINIGSALFVYPIGSLAESNYDKILYTRLGVDVFLCIDTIPMTYSELTVTVLSGFMYNIESRGNNNNTKISKKYKLSSFSYSLNF